MTSIQDSVLISGKFRVIHAGHIRLFRLGKELAKKLIVAIDVSNLELEEIAWRLKVLESIEYVDQVIQYDEFIEPIIGKLQPSIILKGVEFKDATNVESVILEEYGGKLLFTSGVNYFTESDLITAGDENFSRNLLLLPQAFMQRNAITQQKLRDEIEKFVELRVCVIGDVIIDEYINCHPLGMSQEEPTVVVTPIDSKRFLGGAGIVAAHCRSLGAKTTLISVTGEDEIGRWGVEKAKEYGLDVKITVDATRPTTLKQRYRSGTQTLLKVSHLRQDGISTEIQKQIVEAFRSLAEDIDLLIFSDFSYGALTEQVINEITSIARDKRIFISADSQTSSQIGNLMKFKRIDLITPTEREARIELRDQTSGLVIIAEKVRTSVDSKNILLKMGSDGVLISGLDKDRKVVPTDEIKGLNRNAIDTSGAGDSMLAAASLALASGADLYLAALLGSIVAGIQVSRIGNLPISKDLVYSILDL
jgi:rfaE bifunctional protein kinase chain/domain